MKIDDNKHLGVLCHRGHEYKNTGKSLRYKKNGDCIECMKLYKSRRIYPFRPNKKAKKEKARIYASLHCIHYQDCLDKAAKGTWGGYEMPCLGCDRMEVKRDCYLNEIEMGCRQGYSEQTEHRMVLPRP